MPDEVHEAGTSISRLKLPVNFESQTLDTGWSPMIAADIFE
jgi:hypothetical protein